ncbi:MAG: hypothetical protein NTX45_22045 [Proteobacteria bacterium]|nr:hypothetical protein [Pseudomonadota bacterium]
MRKKYLSFVRSLLLLLIASWSILLAGCQEIAEWLARERLGVSILTVNLLGVSNVPRDSQSGVRWRTRYARIFTWMSETKTYPDVIVLQEATGFMQCAFDPTVRDYEAINFLRNGISNAAGEQYRIAYLIVKKPGGGMPTDWTGNIPSGGCSSTGGNALLYRPSRLRNVITSPSAGESVVSPYDSPFPLLTTYLAMSAQCCPLNLDGSDVCPVTTVMDGLMVKPRIGPVFRDTCPTRQGVALTRSRRSFEGSDPSKPQSDAVFSRFELVAEPGSFIHIYNVHRGLGQDPADQKKSGVLNIDMLVTDVESRFNSENNPPLYPPIVVGDLNFGADNKPPPVEEVEGELPRYRMAAWSPANDGVVIGRPEHFRAKQHAYANQVEVIPPTIPGEACARDPATLWSDHCGFYFRVEPSPRRSE